MSLLVVALALALRIAWVLLVPTRPVGDFAMYVESAAHLVEHGALDPEYVYMPGYVLLIAAVQALGGGWLAIKLVGAILGGLGAGAVLGVARWLSGGSRAVALTAGLLYACWPAGIAAASVTGTDTPAAVLVLTAAYVLVRFAGPRPLLAAVLFGLVTGLAAYIRAIVVPLAALSALVFRAHGKPWRQSLAAAALACVVALAVLSPWALRNRLRYGETFFTDSHGGLTALVGANPNTDGRYSRSLNQMFRDVTGFTLLAEPHRQADHASLTIAKEWLAFDPLFTLGLLVAKAERLLVHERALLYWPLFRAGVLPEPERAFFAHHRRTIEAVADGYWMVVLALGLAGAGLAGLRRQWLALSLLPQAGCLAVLYIAIFAEQRYRLPISMLLLPLAAQAMVWLGNTTRGLWRRAPAAGWRRELAVAAGLSAGIFLLAPLVACAGERLRDARRWAVHTCAVTGQTRLCSWKTAGHAGDLGGRPGVRGVWNGVGLALPAGRDGAATLTATSEIDLPAGDYVLRLELDHVEPPGSPSAPPIADGSTLTVAAGGRPLSTPVPLADMPSSPGSGSALPWQAPLRHAGGTLRLDVRIDRPGGPMAAPAGRVWLGNLRIEEAEPTASSIP